MAKSFFFPLRLNAAYPSPPLGALIWLWRMAAALSGPHPGPVRPSPKHPATVKGLSARKPPWVRVWAKAPTPLRGSCEGCRRLGHSQQASRTAGWHPEHPTLCFGGHSFPFKLHAVWGHRQVQNLETK